MDWTDLTDGRYRWLALVNVVMNLLVPYNGGIAGLAEDRVASQKGPFSMK